MPPFPWLFEEKISAGPEDKVVAVPDSIAPKGKVVVATYEAKALAAYLIGMNHTYPVSQISATNDTTKKK